MRLIPPSKSAGAARRRSAAIAHQPIALACRCREGTRSYLPSRPPAFNHLPGALNFGLVPSTLPPQPTHSHVPTSWWRAQIAYDEAFAIWCGRGESNPGYLLGRQEFYR